MCRADIKEKKSVTTSRHKKKKKRKNSVYKTKYIFYRNTGKKTWEQ